MSFSADEGAGADRLSRSLELYREFSDALRDRITRLKAETANEANCKNALDAVRDHNRVLNTVLEIESSLGKRKQAWIDGAVCEVDLAAARDEILARLAVWIERG